MLPAYNSGSETMNTVYMLKEYNKTNSQQKTRKRTERIYYIKQRLSGLIMAAIGIYVPFLLEGDATISLLVLPLGIFLLLTKEKIMTF